MSMASEEADNMLRVFFLPFGGSAGHMYPMVDAAILFARHGVDATVATTPANALIFEAAVARERAAGLRIRITTVPFPSAKAGAPTGHENLPAAPSSDIGMAVGRGLWLLEEPLRELLREARPDCLISDMFFPWTADAAAELGIPRLTLHTSGFIECCADHSLRHHQPHKHSTDSDDVVSLPGLPHKIEILNSQVPEWVRTTNDLSRIMDSIKASELKSYGAVFNTFRELDGPYEDHFVNALGKKAWSIGPLCLWLNQDDGSGKAESYNFFGGEKEEENWEVLKWLSSKEESSVLYVGFGSLTKLNGTQLGELARGLEASGRPFVWVVQKNGWDSLPEGFEERAKGSGRGFLVRGWAPQREILAHPAVGGMVTHCGWNGILEGLAAGLPMITWPMFAEQFFNEKLVTEIAGFGVAVGATEYWAFSLFVDERKEVVKGEQVERAVAELMGGGEEAAARRERARRLAKAAKKATESGGSSQASLMALINELKALKIQSTIAR